MHLTKISVSWNLLWFSFSAIEASSLVKNLTSASPRLSPRSSYNRHTSLSVKENPSKKSRTSRLFTQAAKFLKYK
ncbi:hypothetical protein GDO81_023114 [Engystomops pustulosus]|uniref:Secreted protein n=1 Tax=Engystomops pustulosus TaxID=76066 RepID=A0AAV6YLC9_ENGPU|nr:hypothetical protein GDO81_023114 [Engystomops pustulosus]